MNNHFCYRSYLPMGLFQKIKFIFYFLSVTSLTFLHAQENAVTLKITNKSHVDFSGPMGSNMSFAELHGIDPKSRGQKITYLFFDRQLKENNKLETCVGIKQKFEKGYSDSSGIYAVYGKKNSSAFSLLYCDGKSIKTIDGTFGINAECRSIRGCLGYALIVVAKKKTSYILIADFNSGKTTPLFLNMDNSESEVSVTGIDFLSATQELAVSYLTKTRGEKTLSAIIFDTTLKKKNAFVLSDSQTDRKRLLSASFYAAENNEYIISGMYQDQSVECPDGLYLGKFSDGKWVSNNYYSFMKGFDHFTDYLSAKEIKKNNRRKKFADKLRIEYNLEVFMHTHQLQKVNGTYIFVGEIYKKHYSTEMIGDGSRREFDGYLFVEAIVVGFDSTLQKKWDRSLPIEILLLGDEYVPPKKIVHVQALNDVVAIFFCNATMITDVNVSASGQMDEASFSYFVGKHNEKSSGMPERNADYWYGSYILASGNAKQKDANDKRKHKVFYICMENISVTSHK